MGAYIKPEHLAFLEEVKAVFEVNCRRETHQNEEGTLIALRFGADRDCINVFELGEEIAFFTQQIEPNPNPRLEVMEFSRDMEVQLQKNDHKKGWIQENYDFLIRKIGTHGMKLHEELSKLDKDKSKIISLCANIANYAMMIADNEGEHL
ncbi:hypothetical protein J7E52_10930 [Bacillus sp. ISL-34]|uniref:hypothetical protein n=1 Tax=Bacillus sp. ISL-34 TaxID=2819121 RepID=UPI001BE75961|nr:hypothetical protein [Bacillus sp. ISL-34]MBT2647231.1 hypothetical protein [Bacillus sp. ISL-34]